ncbi:hypothetical protein D3C85_1495660 [compost metagenome]
MLRVVAVGLAQQVLPLPRLQLQQPLRLRADHAAVQRVQHAGGGVEQQRDVDIQVLVHRAGQVGRKPGAIHLRRLALAVHLVPHRVVVERLA